MLSDMSTATYHQIRNDIKHDGFSPPNRFDELRNTQVTDGFSMTCWYRSLPQRPRYQYRVLVEGPEVTLSHFLKEADGGGRRTMPPGTAWLVDDLMVEIDGEND